MVTFRIWAITYIKKIANNNAETNTPTRENRNQFHSMIQYVLEVKLETVELNLKAI